MVAHTFYLSAGGLSFAAKSMLGRGYIVKPCLKKSKRSKRKGYL